MAVRQLEYELHGPMANISLLPQPDGSVSIVEGHDFAESLPDSVAINVVADHRSDKYLTMVKEELARAGVTLKQDSQGVDSADAEKGPRLS